MRLRMVMRSVGRVVKKSGISTSSYSVGVGTAEERVDSVVIGAGVVGIAVARQLVLKGRDVLVLDSAPSFGTATSSRNSQVIHAGIYYPSNSLKAQLCLRGRELLCKYCSQRGVPHRQTGKLIVATSRSKIPKLAEIIDRATLNGVRELKLLQGSEAIQMEPHLHCIKALLSPLSRIVDSHAFMLALLGEAETHGATFSYNSTVIGGHLKADGKGNTLRLHVAQTCDVENWDGQCPLLPELVLVPKLVVNSVRLSAWALATRFNASVAPLFLLRTSPAVAISPSQTQESLLSRI